MISSPITWYVARAGGVVAYVLLTASVVAGITLAGRVRVPGFPRFTVEDVHRFLGLFAAAFVAVHVAGIALDATVPFAISELAVPFTASFRPIWTGLGVVALELLIALAITNALRDRMPYRVWRSLHAGSLVVWGAATLHGLMAGTDRDQTWMIAVFTIAAVAVVGSLAARLAASRPGSRTLIVAIGCASAAAALVVGLSRVPLPAATGAAPLADVSGDLTGSISKRSGNGAQLVSIVGEVETGSTVPFRIDLVTRDDEIADTSLQIRSGSTAGSSLCSGSVTSLDDSGFKGTCTLPDGSAREVRGTWSVSGESLTGTLTSRA